MTFIILKVITMIFDDRSLCDFWDVIWKEFKAQCYNYDKTPSLSNAL